MHVHISNTMNTSSEMDSNLKSVDMQNTKQSSKLASMLSHFLLDNRKGIRPVNTSSTNPKVHLWETRSKLD